MERKERAKENCLLGNGNLTSDPTNRKANRDGGMTQGHMEVQLGWRNYTFKKIF